MGDRTEILWSDATWNPVSGCTKVSPGCDRCYAERFAERFRGHAGHYYERGFDVVERPDMLDRPARWRRPRLVFVNSMSDIFHEQITAEFRDRIFEVMERETHHCYQILTKRSGAMLRYVNRRYPSPYARAPQHMWFGVSVEDRVRLVRIAHLAKLNSERRFVSAEPLLEHLEGIDLSPVDWLIAGGESGPGYRAPDADALRALRDACARTNTPFVFKQWGGNRPNDGGRELDGTTHEAYPRAMTGHIGREARQEAERPACADAK